MSSQRRSSVKRKVNAVECDLRLGSESVRVGKEGIERLILFSPFNWPLYLLVVRTLHLCIGLSIDSIFMDCLLCLPCPRDTKTNGPVSSHLMALEPSQSWLTSRMIMMGLSRILKFCHFPKMAWRHVHVTRIDKQPWSSLRVCEITKAA